MGLRKGGMSYGLFRCICIHRGEVSFIRRGCIRCNYAWNLVTQKEKCKRRSRVEKIGDVRGCRNAAVHFLKCCVKGVKLCYRQ